jgi:hypothetical protein
MLIIFGIQFLLQYRSIILKGVLILYCSVGLFLSGIHSVFYLSLLEEPNALTVAGDWINKNIPKDHSIGIQAMGFAQSSVPPIQFLNYKIIQFPHPQEKVLLKNSDLPDYVIISNPEHSILQQHYTLVQKWTKREKFLGLRWDTHWSPNPNMDLFVFQKKVPKDAL